MAWVNDPSSASPPASSGLSPTTIGTICCVVSALGYTAANICLRAVAEGCDPIWVTCVKAAVAVSILGPWLAYQACRGRARPMKLTTLAKLVAAALGSQFGGNLGMQYAYATIGLAVAVPTAFGAILIASAVMGRILLGETISRRSVMSLALLIGAIAMLAFGGADVNQAIADGGESVAGPFAVMTGIAAACLAGTCYAMLTITVRHVVGKSVSPMTVVFVGTSTGFVCMSTLSLWRLGTAKMLETQPIDLAVMIGAGVFNLLAFLALAKGLQRTAVVRANVLNASQVAMCALAGMLLFAEPAQATLVGGVLLTIVGMVFLDEPPGSSA